MIKNKGRWDTYVLHRGPDLIGHWKERLKGGATIALVCGIGFDPRMCLGLELLAGVAAADRLKVFAINFPAPADPLAASSAGATKTEFGRLTAGLSVEELHIEAGEGLEHLARRAAELFENLDRFAGITDIVVDVNALPRSVFFPMVSKLLYLCEQREASAPNLHILAGDAAWLDELVTSEGLDEHATWLHPFAGTFLSETDRHLPRVWMPVLGEGTELALERISILVDPDETCPLLPFPSQDPRRSDKLFEQYRRVLFDRLQSDSGAIIYAAEANPFQVYRRLRESSFHYASSLDPLGGCKVAYSALSSKLVSIGVLLAAYELRDIVEVEIGVADIGVQQRRLARSVSLDEARSRTELIGLTISGDSYH